MPITDEALIQTAAMQALINMAIADLANAIDQQEQDDEQK